MPRFASYCEYCAEAGSFKARLDARHPQTKDGWLAIFRKAFAFTGGEIVGEFMMSAG